MAGPGGRIIVHDGDYASLTFDTGAPELDRKLPAQYLQTLVTIPYVMREMPRLLGQCDVEITQAMGDVVLEVGDGEYFPGLARNYGPVAVSAGVAAADDVEAWTQPVDNALSENVFFGACNLVTYCAVKPG